MVLVSGIGRSLRCRIETASTEGGAGLPISASSRESHSIWCAADAIAASRERTAGELPLAPYIGSISLHGPWIQQGFAVAPSFLQTARDDYSATVEQVDFMRAPTQVAMRINRWVSDRTATRIPSLIGPDAIDDTTRLVVTNAVYFLGDWRQPFEPGATARQDVIVGVTSG